MDLELGEEFPVKSVGELRDFFFKYHKLKKRERIGTKRRAHNPIALRLNPINSGFAILDDDYYAVYYRHYYVKIEKGKTLFGPHIATLYIQIYVGKNVWLGTAQFKCNFFDRKTIRKKLRLAITNERYYCSEKSAEEFVELEPRTSEHINL